MYCIVERPFFGGPEPSLAVGEPPYTPTAVGPELNGPKGPKVEKVHVQGGPTKTTPFCYQL